MQKWFKEYYYDEDYQAVSWNYYMKVVSKSRDSNMYTGSNRGAVHPADVEKGEDSKNDANNDDVAVTTEPAPQGARDGED